MSADPLFDAEEAAFRAWLAKYRKWAPNELHGFSIAYDPDAAREWPRWWEFVNTKARPVSTIRCPKCRAVLARVKDAPPVVFEVDGEQSIDGEHHEIEVHPGGRAVLLEAPAAVVDSQTLAERNAAIGRSRFKRYGAGRVLEGWWVADEPDRTDAMTWCSGCGAYRKISTRIH